MSYKSRDSGQKYVHTIVDYEKLVCVGRDIAEWFEACNTLLQSCHWWVIASIPEFRNYRDGRIRNTIKRSESQRSKNSEVARENVWRLT